MQNSTKICFNSLFEIKKHDFIEAIKAYIIVMFMECLLQLILFLVTKSIPITMVFSFILIAPIVEECAKLKCIQKGKIGAFLIVLNVCEFVIYCFMAPGLGTDIITMAYIRIFPICMHYLTSWNTSIGVYKTKETGQFKDTKVRLLGSMCIHFMNNLPAAIATLHQGGPTH